MSNLLLLHGAIGAAGHFEKLVKRLENDYRVYTMNFPGHGGEALPGGPFSIPLFAEAVLKYMDENGIEQTSVFGYSMGGYVAMYLAKYYPGRVEKIITLATKFHWDKETAAREVQMLNADKIVAKIPAFAEALERRHAPNDWKAVLRHTGDMLYNLGEQNTLQPDDYPSITHPVLVLLGDRDKMITLEETVAVYKSLPDAQMGVLPGTPHPIEQVDTSQLSFFIKRFIPVMSHT